MALTDEIHLATSPIGQFMRRVFPYTRTVRGDWRERTANASTIRPAGNPPWAIIGAAIDYRIRFYFPGMDPRRTVGWSGGHSAPDRDTSVQRADRSDPVLQHLCRFVDLTQPSGRPLGAADEAALNRWCFVLAHLDLIVRTGEYSANVIIPDPAKWRLGWGRNPEPLLALADAARIDDLSALSALFFERCSDLLTLPTVLNPTFDGSWHVGGADADLIVDGCLIDIKTTTNLKPDNRTFYQLLAYTLLDYSDRYEIRTVGIYLARQGILLKWPLDEFMNSMAGGDRPSLPELRAEFRAIVATEEDDEEGDDDDGEEEPNAADA